MDINQKIAQELNVKITQVESAIKLLDEGATVPFISRYRKEVTGGLSDTQLRLLEERLIYLREFSDRQQTILKSIEEQGKLTNELKKAILSAETKAKLEDLYLPFKPKRRTKAQIAREAGLEPLADALLENPELEPVNEAKNYLNTEHKIDSPEIALDGARQILMERFSENAELLEKLRDYLWHHGVLFSKVAKGKDEEAIKYTDYFDFQEPIKKIPSHRALALFRGRKEGFLQVELKLPDEAEDAYCEGLIAKAFQIENKNRPADAWIMQAVKWTWSIKLHIKLELELSSQLREIAEAEAINVFQSNLKNLLMASPAGNHVSLGLDPGFRTGVKVVVVDGTGKLLEYLTIFPHPPQKQWDDALHQLASLVKKYHITLVSIGNGTASRETDRLVAELIKQHPEFKLTKVVVSEAGASVYSASELGAQEFPDLNVSYRGAVSIARRLQDPLAELVKIDPKAIGVGQYQHDVNQIKLSRTLGAVVEDCVNAVGTDVNTASIPLLTKISGLNETLARNIVLFRETNGRFKKREDLKNVSRMGEKTYEQAIGFLRIMDGDNPLDASAVHPEAYPVVEAILKQVNKKIGEVMGHEEILRTLKPEQYINHDFGLPTVKDILNELAKPARDPRPEFKTASFQEGVETIEDLKPGMVLEGVVSNVANFGAFVDIGVHQDGLVHISEMANHYVEDPHKVVKVGQIVKVRVLEVDVKRKRIQLSMKQSGSAIEPQKSVKPPQKKQKNVSRSSEPAFASALKQAFLDQ